MGARISSWIAIFLVSSLPAVATCEALYAASVRGSLASGSNQVGGSLYRVDPETGKYTAMSSIRMDGVPIGVTGLADHPKTGALYGVTSSFSPASPQSLVSIDPQTGEAKLIGHIGTSASDISFNREGTLYAWLRQTGQLATLDLSSGAVKALGAPRNAGEPGGMAVDSKGRFYVAATGAAGTLDTVDPSTGAITPGPAIQGAPYPAGINSLSFSPAGVLYAVNTNLGSPAATMLITIDPATGRVTPVSALPSDTDALVFSQESGALSGFATSRGGLSLFAALACLAIGLGIVVTTRKR